MCMCVCICLCVLFKKIIFSMMVFTECWGQFSVLCSRSLLFIHSLYKARVCGLLPSSPASSPLQPPVCSLRLQFCVCFLDRLVCVVVQILCVSDNCVAFVFLKYLTQDDNLQWHPRCCTWHQFVLFVAEWYSIVCIYTSFLVHSSVYGLLDCVHVSAFINSAAVSTGVHVSFWVRVLSGYTGPFYFKKRLQLYF